MLTTKRLLIRQARLTDLDDIFTIMSDPQAMAHWSTAPHPSPDVTRPLIEGMANAPDPVTYFVFERDNRTIGMGGMHSGNEVGIMLHPAFWRQGYAFEAMGAILAHIWNKTDEAFVHADVDPRNTASVNLLSSLGFHETHRAARTFFINGVWSDSVYFRLNRPRI